MQGQDRPSAQRQLFVGLGNPGEQHARNRHNIGFLALERIAAQHGFPAARERFGGLLQEGRMHAHSLLLFRPLSFMNQSGVAVAAAVRFFRLAPRQVVVFHDELDLAAGRLRVKSGGGTAGHNGLRSLVQHIGADFRRVRLGIGHPGAPERVLSHVLANFARQDAAWLEPLLDAIAENAPLLAAGRDDAFASRTHYTASGPGSAAAAGPRQAGGAAPEQTSEKAG